MTVTRIFDHLDGASSNALEDAHFSRVARRMRRSSWWSATPVREEPAPVSGEIDTDATLLARLGEMAKALDPAALDHVMLSDTPKARAIVMLLKRVGSAP